MIQSGDYQILNDIINLQDIERTIIKEQTYSDVSSTSQENALNRINDLSTLRQNLYQTLSGVYMDEAIQTGQDGQDIHNQYTTAKLVEKELSENKINLQKMKNLKYDTVKQVEINTYYKKQAMAQTSILKSITLICIPVLLLSILLNKQMIPSGIGTTLIIVILVVGCIMIGYKVWDYVRRDNMNFDEYKWYWNNSSQQQSVYEYDVSQLQQWGESIDLSDSMKSLSADLGTCIGQGCCSEGMIYDSISNKCT
jgi:hypothetical protein